MDSALLRQAVSDELIADPKIDPAQIAISADDTGTVRLEGTVGSWRQKIEAGRAAQRVRGDYSVGNDLQVRILGGTRTDDAELRGNILQALRLDSLVPSTIDATVENGVVTLKGTANWQYERSEAESVAGNVHGVRDIRSEIVLDQQPGAADIESTIAQEIARISILDADDITVDSTDGKVTLSGVVASWPEHDAALDAAWMVPGVTQVQDNIEVRY